MTKKVSRREQRDRIAEERHSELRIRNGGCAPGYDGPCMGPTFRDYAWADRQMLAAESPEQGENA